MGPLLYYSNLGQGLNISPLNNQLKIHFSYNRIFPYGDRKNAISISCQLFTDNIFTAGFSYESRFLRSKKALAIILDIILSKMYLTFGKIFRQDGKIV